METDLGWWSVVIAVIGGAIRISTPFLFVSLGETITEKSGRINLGLEGTLIFGAMAAYAVAHILARDWAAGAILADPSLAPPGMAPHDTIAGIITDRAFPQVDLRIYGAAAWIGLLAAGISGALFGLLHGWICSFKRVNDIAVGIALMLFGTGIAFFFGKPFVAPVAPDLPSVDLGFWTSIPQLHDALRINILFPIGIVLAIGLWWAFRDTKTGLVIRTVGDNADAARALGYNVNRVRVLSTAAGGVLAGIAGAFLSLYYPGSWKEDLSSGQGLMAVALVIFARWNPVGCFWAALLFGASSALGPALQGVGVGAYYFFNAAPYILTLGIMILTSSKTGALAGAPGELSITR